MVTATTPTSSVVDLMATHPYREALEPLVDEAPLGDGRRIAGDPSELTRLGVVWLGGAVAISSLLVLATAATAFFDPGGLLGYVLHRLNLAVENNPAATWSGMLLALTSAHAFDGHVRERLRDADLALGWALIALVLLALSADEVGSLHERVGLLGLGSWWPLLPFALVLGGMMVYGLILLWRAPSHRRKAVLLALGFVLMGSVALQEFLEHRIELTTAGAKAFRVALEEGSEICGMLIVLHVVMRNTAGLTTARGSEVAFQAASELRLLLAGSALVLAPFLAYFTSLLADYLHRGRPADWAAALLLLAAALAACGARIATGRSLGWRRWLFCALCGFAVLSAVECDPDGTIALGPFVANARLLVLGTLGLLAWAVWTLDREARSRRFYAIGGVVLAALAGGSLLPLGLFAVYLLSQFVAVTIYLVCADPQARTSPEA